MFVNLAGLWENSFSYHHETFSIVLNSDWDQRSAKKWINFVCLDSAVTQSKLPSHSV